MVDKVDNVEQEIAGSRAVDRASGNVDVSPGISESNNTIDKTASNVDVKAVDKVDNVEQEIAGSRTVDKVSGNVEK